MTEANLKFIIEKMEQYGLNRPDCDQLGDLISRLEAERDSLDGCLSSITSLMQKHPQLTPSQFIGPFLRMAGKDLGAKIIDPFLGSKGGAAITAEKATENDP